MPQINTLNTTAIAFIGRLSENEELPTGELIQICGEFQRGDEDTGVWPTPMKRAYIDSLLKGYPTGVTMIVKPPGASHTTKWMILDGANRARALRDFMNDKFTTSGETKEDRKKFSQLNTETRVVMQQRAVHIQEIRITRDDPVDIIADLFSRINTKICPLKPGELIKAHGWLKNIPIIETAKGLVGGRWHGHMEEIPAWIQTICTSWHELFPPGTHGERETKRCSNLATMCGMIVSSIEEDIVLLDSDYKKLKRHLTPENSISTELATRLTARFTNFLNIMSNIPNVHDIMPSQCGMPKKKKCFPIWGFIIGERMTNIFRERLIQFYTDIQNDSNLKAAYEQILSRGGDSHITLNKLNAVYNLINLHAED